MVWTTSLLPFIVAAWAIPSSHNANPTTSPSETVPVAGAMSTPSTQQHELNVRPRLSKRVLDTEPAHIEAVLSRYSDMTPRPANLAQGVAHWDPPPSALHQIEKGSKRDGGLAESSNHKYGPALGLTSLREALVRKLERENSLDMTGQEVLITAGGNQAFAMVALALLDPGDRVLLARPFYCAHLCAVQLAGGTVAECRWEPSTLLPDMADLKREVEKGVKMVVVTTPGNPTGAVCPRDTMVEIAQLCKKHNAWLVVDEAYEHFLHDGESHYSPCGNRLGCPDNVIHLFSMSKSFGLAGWRVGYAVYPKWASEEMVKVQDTLPTHACTASQKVALAALEDNGCDWARSKVSSLSKCRESMWSAVKDMGGVMGKGAFYFLVPVPVEEDKAIDILARRWGVLTTPGRFGGRGWLNGGHLREGSRLDSVDSTKSQKAAARAFGAPGHIRVSYGSLPEEECLPAIQRLREGLQAMTDEVEAGAST